jgi:hypothetical protein
MSDCVKIILKNNPPKITLKSDATVVTRIEYPQGIIQPPTLITPWMQLMFDSYVSIYGAVTFEQKSIILRVLSPSYEITGEAAGYYATTYAAKTDASWIYFVFLTTEYYVIAQPA